ncbi:MAG: TonB-dependent receptor plug domain-containing protein [Pseudomonadota bacterium]
MRRLSRSLLAAASSLVLTSFTSAAWAQDASPAVGLDEVVVTAERVETNIQRAPMAISAVTGEALSRAGVTRIMDLTKKVPGLEIASADSLTQIYVRGVGANIASSYSERAVAFNLDQAYVAGSTSIGGNFYGLERVKVLKGPQGTLYGRSATGGALNVITNKPKLGELAGDAMLELGNYDAVKFNGALQHSHRGRRLVMGRLNRPYDFPRRPS